MTFSDRIQRDYDFFLKLLKFCIKNDSKEEFRDFSLVSSYLQILTEVEKKLTKKLGTNFMNEPYDYDHLLTYFFRGRAKEYRPLIDNKEKKELLKRFQMIIDIANMAIDRKPEEEEGWVNWMEDIYNELKTIKKTFLPVIKLISQEKK